MVFVTLNVIISHTFSKNFIAIFLVVQKLRRLSLSILAIFIDFYQFSGFFYHFRVTKKLMTSVYNR